MVIKLNDLHGMVLGGFIVVSWVDLVGSGLPKHGLENGSGADFAASELVKNAAVSEHHHTCAKAHKLFDFTGQINYRLAGCSEVAQMVIEFGFGAHIDPTRGIIENQNVRVQRECATDQHLLLVAAAERRDLVGALAHADGQTLHFPVERAQQAIPADDAQPATTGLAAV